MSAPRRPADIAADLRHAFDNGLMVDRLILLDDLDDLDARWPTADEIAELRGDVATLRGPWTGDATVHGVAARLSHFLDRLDPPQPEPQDDDDVDPDGRSGVDYCLVHHALRDEDADYCSGADGDDYVDCVLVELTYDPAAARAALDARAAS